MGKLPKVPAKKKPLVPSASGWQAAPMPLILRKSSGRPAGLIPDIWGEDDYSVVDGETRVGHIYPEMIHGEPKWRWFLQTVPAPPPNSGVIKSWRRPRRNSKRRYAEVKGGT
jgi:hypothetical protein